MAPTNAMAEGEKNGLPGPGTNERNQRKNKLTSGLWFPGKFTERDLPGSRNPKNVIDEGNPPVGFARREDFL